MLGERKALSLFLLGFSTTIFVLVALSMGGAWARCFYALAAVDTPAAAEALLALLESSRTALEPEPWLYAQCAWQLGRTGQEWVLPRLVLCLKYEKDGQTAVWIADSAARMGVLAGLDALFAVQRGTRPDECSGCAIQSRCGSTCACLNLRLGGSPHAVDALLCAHERMVTLAADRIAARLWRKRARAFLRRQYDPHHDVLSTCRALVEEALSR